MLGDDFAWEHEGQFCLCSEVPFDDAPEQLLGTSHQYAVKLAACLQVGLEGAVAAKLKAEKELLAAKDQIVVLEEKVNTLTEQLSIAQDERQLALERLAQLEEDGKVRDVELQSCRTSLEREQKRAEVAEGKVEALSRSLVEKQTALDTTTFTAEHWCNEWKKLAAETEEMCQESVDVVMDQIHHLSPVVDFSVITLDTCWDPKGRRIYNPKAAAGEDSQLVEEPMQPEPEPRTEQSGAGGCAVGSGCC
ncbi:hypothetical protein PIB30_001399 [Stylosanthes scabra]|uniref:Uncharacterized protein n=1 Tax=Stylosanthes scabra TaxID=79078 RepID=A0ABU6Z1C8_9FABA|nr:hypothetical protein [Stylosanthes scabra]